MIQKLVQKENQTPSIGAPCTEDIINNQKNPILGTTHNSNQVFPAEVTIFIIQEQCIKLQLTIQSPPRSKTVIAYMQG